ncbi:hypothetical protein ACSSS7_000552 [Eimeria intestinalis]
MTQRRLKLTPKELDKATTGRRSRLAASSKVAAYNPTSKRYVLDIRVLCLQLRPTSLCNPPRTQPAAYSAAAAAAAAATARQQHWQQLQQQQQLPQPSAAAVGVRMAGGPEGLLGSAWEYVLGSEERRSILGYDYLVKLLLIASVSACWVPLVCVPVCPPPCCSAFHMSRACL